MEGNIQEIGLIIICTGKVFILGKMGENTKGTILMIRKMLFLFVFCLFIWKYRGMEFILGLMAENMRDSGRMGNKMGMGSMF